MVALGNVTHPERKWVDGPLIVGAGPSGLAVAAGLRRHKVPFLILDQADCIASLWKHRTYNRLKLHLPRSFCEVPYMVFPKDYPEYPSRDQFIIYLESNAKHFDIKPYFNETVVSASYDDSIVA